VADQDWDVLDEYVDRVESARSSDRPEPRATLTGIAEDGDVEAWVVHKNIALWFATAPALTNAHVTGRESDSIRRSSNGC
jgi:hypothetical protein